MAAALKADECQIFTDVDGVYTTDPRVEPKARRLSKITFEEMQARAVPLLGTPDSPETATEEPVEEPTEEPSPTLAPRRIRVSS